MIFSIFADVIINHLIIDTMEQTSTMAAPSRKVKTLRILVLALLFFNLFPFWNDIMYWIFGPIYEWHQSPQFVMMRIVFPLIYVAAIVIYALLACDRQVRFAAILCASTRLISAVLLYIQESTQTYFDVVISFMIFHLAVLYFISVVMGKNQSGTNIWIALLLIGIPINIAESLFVLPYLRNPSMMLVAWNILISVLAAIAYYHMAYSNVFAGPADSSDDKAKMPLMSFNRYFWIGLALSVFASVVFWVCDAFVLPVM